MIERTRTAVLGLVILSICGGVALGHGVHATPTPVQGDQAPAAAEPEQTLPLPSGVDFLVPLQEAFSTADAESDETVQFSTLYHWRVTGGQIIVHFNEDFLSQLGLEVQEIQATALPPQDRVIPLEPPFVGFAIQPDSTFEFDSIESVFEQFNGGELQFSGGFTLAGDGLAAPIHDFSISEQASQRDGMESTGEFALVTAAEHGLTELVLDPPSIVDVDFAARTLILSGLGVSLSDGVAAQLDRPELAGQLIGMAAVLANIEILGTELVEPLETASDARGINGLDVKLGILSSLSAVGRTGSFPAGNNGLSMATTSCNVGSVDVNWFAPMAEDHPGIAMNLYRIHNGRFEQIGASDVKHGFFALSNSQCTPCENPSGGSFLGVGCSDTYGVGNNSNRNWLAPRGEWDSFAATWTALGSHFDGTPVDGVRSHGSSGHDATQHRLQVTDLDLDVSTATYYYEAFYLVSGDSLRENNIGYRQTNPNWNGSSWTFSNAGALIEGPAIKGWADVSHRREERTGNGVFIIGWETRDLGGGMWHYEYVVFNWYHQKGFRTLKIPLGAGAIVSNIGMHDVDSDPSNDWTATVSAGEIAFSTPDIGGSNPNPITWDMTYTFWFDADAAPVSSRGGTGLVTMDVFDPLGDPVADPAVITIPGVPVPGSPAIDCSCGDLAEPSGGNVTLVDFAAFSICFSADIGANPQCTCSDLNGDLTIDLNDFNTFSLLFGLPVNGLSPPNCLSP